MASQCDQEELPYVGRICRVLYTIQESNLANTAGAVFSHQDTHNPNAKHR